MRKSLRLFSALIAMALAFAGLMLMSLPGTAQPATPRSPTGLLRCSSGIAAPSAPADATPGANEHTPIPSDSPVLRTLTDIPLPGDTSRFDYQSLDPVTGPLYIAHMDAGQLLVFDTRAQRIIATVGDLPTVTGVLVVPELHRVFASIAGDHQVAVIDTHNLSVIARVGKIGFPDGLAYAPRVKRVFVSDESGGGEVVIDATTNRVVTTIDIGGEAGNTQDDPGSGCILVAVQSRNKLFAIDPTTDQIIAQFDVDSGCEGPHGMLVDAPNGLAFIACENNARLLIVDLQTMQVTGMFPVGEGPDVLAFDPGWHRLYVASESGMLSVFAEQPPTLQPLGQVTISNAHSVTVDPRTHLVYLPLADVGGKPVLRIMQGPPGS